MASKESSIQVLREAREKVFLLVQAIVVGITLAEFLPNFVYTLATSLSTLLARGGIHGSLLLMYGLNLALGGILVTLVSGQGGPEPELRLQDGGWRRSVLPLGIALLFGLVQWRVISGEVRVGLEDWIYFCLLVPIAEECLFRGALYEQARRLWGQSYFSATNPLPSHWVFTSVAFSLWHIQNMESFPTVSVVLQVLYTPFVGLWLCQLRSQPRGLARAIVAHSALNAASIFFVATFPG